MRCKDCEKFIHLYLDKKLDEQKRKEIEKHLSECPRCKEKFEALKMVEGKARGIEIPEPEEAYWQTFSQRVRERIISKQRQPFGIRLKEFVGNVFVFTPQRLRIAAAVASIVLVFIVGKLYIDYRGTIPEKIKLVEKEIPKAEKIERALEAPATIGEKPAPAPELAPPRTEKKRVVDQKAAEIKEEATKEELEKPTPLIQPESKEVAAGAGVEPMAKKGVTRDIAEKEPVAGVMEQEALKTVEKEDVPKAAMTTMADVEDKKAKPESKVEAECFIDKMPPQEKMAPQEMCVYWFADSIQIPDIDYFGSKLSTDSLRVISDFWKKFVQDNPADPFVEYAYLQIAAAYYYSFDKTKDEAIREQVIKEIEEFLKISQKEEIKEELIKRVEKLKDLKEN